MFASAMGRGDFSAQELVEIPLLLPTDQVEELEQLAFEQRQTLGQYLRQIILRSCSGSTTPHEKPTPMHG